MIVLTDEETEKQQVSAKELHTDDATHPSIFDLQSADCQDSSLQREVARESLLSADQSSALVNGTSQLSRVSAETIAGNERLRAENARLSENAQRFAQMEQSLAA